MSGETLFQAPKKHHVKKMRVHDYLYDSAFIVSGARDYARTAFKAAMGSAQLVIQPVYQTMFSDLRKSSRVQVVYHPNCRLPQHMDRSYGAYLRKVRDSQSLPAPHLAGRDRFKFVAIPKKVLAVKSASPEFHPPSPRPAPAAPRDRASQTLYRESSAQTRPWQPEARVAEPCEDTPEVLHLDQLEWGPGSPYRNGDLPADFHTTEIINKMRHARKWNELVERGRLPRWMKRSDGIIEDVETKDWIFREAEIDELQEIRLSLLHRIQTEERGKACSRTSRKLQNMWAMKKDHMERKIENIRRTRDRELRKLSAVHSGGGLAGAVARSRSARGGTGGAAGAGAAGGGGHAALARHGWQAARRHAVIYYDPTLLSLEEHAQVSAPPAWLASCGELRRSCSGHHLPRAPHQLCERETRWTEDFLETLHNDLKKARLGAMGSAGAGPLHVLKPRRVHAAPRPATPQVDAVPDAEEDNHQAALLLQRILRGRAVQNLMYEGRTRAAELTEELKTTHGLQPDDRARIAQDQARARDHAALATEADQKEEAITALVDELCGGAVSAALDFLEKELRRLKDERRQHAFILIALREKTMREAAEAGRRQKEEQRRREHDEIFKQVLGVAQETVEVYLQEIISEGVQLAAEEDALREARARADRVQLSLREHQSMSTAEQNEAVAELVHSCLLSGAAREAARARLQARERARRDVRDELFGVLDDAEIKEQLCVRCGGPLDEACRCRACAPDPTPEETISRDDPRWKLARARPRPPEKTLSERYPPHHEIRCMLNTLVDEAVAESRAGRYSAQWARRDCELALRERLEAALDATDMVNFAVSRATGETPAPGRQPRYRHLMLRRVGDALARTQPPQASLCPRELPSAIRAREAAPEPGCRCHHQTKVTFTLEKLSPEEKSALLPSELRELEEMMRCKCDATPSPSPGATESEVMSETESSAVHEEDNV